MLNLNPWQNNGTTPTNMASRSVPLRVQATAVNKDARSVVDDGGVGWRKGISVNMRKS